MENSFMTFHHVQGEYERNNRTNTTKAIRCFPRCRVTGHCKSGFCGTPLWCTLEVKIDQQSPPCQIDDEFWSNVTYIAEMRESSTPGLSSVRFVSRLDVTSQLRSKVEKHNGLIEGKITKVRSFPHGDSRSTKVIDLEFNSQCQAWHYGWQSHKFKKDTKHCVDVLVLVENGTEGYFVAASFMSPEFELVCTKTVQKKVGMQDEGISQALRLSKKSRATDAVAKSMSDTDVDDEDDDEERVVLERGVGGGGGGDSASARSQDVGKDSLKLQSCDHPPPAKRPKILKRKGHHPKQQTAPASGDDSPLSSSKISSSPPLLLTELELELELDSDAGRDEAVMLLEQLRATTFDDARGMGGHQLPHHSHQDMCAAMNMSKEGIVEL